MATFYTEQDFFKHQQPLSFWIRVQFRIPEIIYNNLYATDNSYPIYDDYYETESRLYIDKVTEDSLNEKNPTTEYWVDVTTQKLSNSSRYYNNNVTAFDLDDVGGVKNFTVVLFDRNWGNLEQLLTFALQCPYFDKDETYNRPESTVAKTN